VATISYQGTTSVVPGATFPPVGFSRCRLKNQGLKALGHRPLRSARLKARPAVSTFLTVAGLAWEPNIWCLLIKVEALCFSGPVGR